MSASHVELLSYSPWPQLEAGEIEVEFHLVYQGNLPAAGHGGGKTRTREKHAMRKVFHKQLVNLWKTHPFLSSFRGDKLCAAGGKLNAHGLEERYVRCGFKFLPLVSKWFGVSCALDILFLRRDGPGSLIRSGGDIDNRLKVLFDGLRMPEECDEVSGQPTVDEDPFFVLLENDNLISKVRVETNWLLTSPAEGEHIHDVHLIIGVKTIMTEGSNKYETAFQ
jgi:hypothetical protein